jgi:hypothetical protein
MVYVVEALLWILVAALGLACAVRGRILFNDGRREGGMDFLRLLPKVMIGVIGSGYIAAIMPPEIIGRWLGPDSGFFGVLLAVIGGALTPGGPVVGFSISAAALKSGAASPQVIAYMTGLGAVRRATLRALGIADHAARADLDAADRIAAAAVPRGGWRHAAGPALRPNASPCRCAA